jgi:hypothetical protein
MREGILVLFTLICFQWGFGRLAERNQLVQVLVEAEEAQAFIGDRIILGLLVSLEQVVGHEEV